jgi:hypothetical protein
MRSHMPNLFRKSGKENRCGLNRFAGPANLGRRL